MKNVTVLFPGGFKPITGAHMALAQRYAQNPNVDKVIMLIGPKERDGITRDTSIKMFNLLNKNTNIEIQPTNFNSPIMAAYEYLFELPEDTQGRFALAASEKDDDYVRVKSFLPNIDKYKTVGDRSGRKIPAGVDAIELTVSIDPLKYKDGNAISASTVRAALNADAYSKFKASYPNYDESIIKNIWQMLGGAPTYGDVMGSEIQKSIKDIEDGDVILLDNGKKFKVDYIDPWSAGGRILNGTDLETSKKVKLKIKFLTPRGNTGLADDTMLTVLKELGGAPTYGDVMGEGDGLWANIRAKRKRGGTPAKKGSKAYKAAKKAGDKINKESIGIQEWFLQELEADVNELFEDGGYMTPKGSQAHAKKIKKLRKALDKQDTEDGFVYNFDKYPKTVFGTKYLNEGGLGGHMSHPFDKNRSQSLSFADFKEMIQRGLQGRLDIESAVTEKTDGQNIFMTFKDGEVKFARNKTERKNPLSVKGLQAKFANRGPISAAFGEAGNDLAAAFQKISPEQLQNIFQNGKVFANMEIIYPDTKNVIAYEIAVLQFHNLVEYDENGNVVQTDLDGGNVVQKAVTDANADMQNTFNLIPPQKIKIGAVENFQDYQDALFNELDQLRDKYNLKDTDSVSTYHKAWWRDLIKEKASKVGYDIPEEIIDQLVTRWSFNDKSNSIVKIKKQITNPEFVEWVTIFDKKDFKLYQKQNLEPFESIFLKLGAEIMKNASNFLAANPTAAVQSIRKEIAQIIRELRSTGDIGQMALLKTQLERIKQLGGFEKIVPVEGIVFTYGGNTYKLTGAFAPINQILGTLKYYR